MNEKITIGDYLDRAQQRLRKSGCSDSPSLEAQWIIEKATGLHRSEFLTHPEVTPSAEAIGDSDNMIDAVIAGEPLPYVLGDWSFCGNSFIVSPAVLIPRPETELLVERAVRWIRENPQARLFADIGTGSGCIAVSILKLLSNPQIQGIASDISRSALKVARKNIKNHQLQNRLMLIQGSLADALAGSFDLICANLPYIPSGRCAELPVAQHEPLIALDGGADGFDYYREFLTNLKGKMAQRALIICEIDFTQKKLAADFAAECFPDARITIEKDYAGLSRILMIQIG